jgi:hypothetical protein
MKIATIWLWLLTIPVLVTIARADEPQIQQFSDPKHPGMAAWKVDYVLPEDKKAELPSQPTPACLFHLPTFRNDEGLFLYR